MWIYLALLLILVTLFYHVENFETKKKGILVLYGESFRSGNIGSRVRDCDECVETQKLASQSHVDFIHYVEQTHNLTLDVLIDTYDTQYEDSLKGYYNQPAYYSHPELLGWDGISQHAVNQIDKNNYDFILMTRVDILIKPEFHTLFQPSWKKIMFLSPQEAVFDQFMVCGFSQTDHGFYYPQVNPTIMFFPPNYFYTLKQLNAGHYAWKHYMDTFQLTEKDMGFMVDYQFNTNSANVNNPYYKMVGRQESDIPINKEATIQQPLFGKEDPNCYIDY
jgi:hypothetical protein